MHCTSILGPLRLDIAFACWRHHPLTFSSPFPPLHTPQPYLSTLSPQLRPMLHTGKSINRADKHTRRGIQDCPGSDPRQCLARAPRKIPRSLRTSFNYSHLGGSGKSRPLNKRRCGGSKGHGEQGLEDEARTRGARGRRDQLRGTVSTVCSQDNAENLPCSML